MVFDFFLFFSSKILRSVSTKRERHLKTGSSGFKVKALLRDNV